MAQILETTWEALENHEPLPNNYFTADYEHICVLYEQLDSVECSQAIAYIDMKHKSVPVTMAEGTTLMIDGQVYEGMSVQEAAWKLYGRVLEVMHARIMDGTDPLSCGFLKDSHPMKRSHAYMLDIFREMVPSKFLRTMFLTSSHPVDILLAYERQHHYREQINQFMAPEHMFSAKGCATAFMLEALANSTCKNGLFLDVEQYISRALTEYKESISDKKRYASICTNCHLFFMAFDMMKKMFPSEEMLALSMQVRREINGVIGKSGSTKHLNVYWEAKDGIHKVSAQRNDFSVESGSLGNTMAAQDTYWLGLFVSLDALTKIPETDAEWIESGLYDGNGLNCLIPYDKLVKITDLKDKTLWSRNPSITPTAKAGGL